MEFFCVVAFLSFLIIAIAAAMKMDGKAAKSKTKRSTPSAVTNPSRSSPSRRAPRHDDDTNVLSRQAPPQAPAAAAGPARADEAPEVVPALRSERRGSSRSGPTPMPKRSPEAPSSPRSPRLLSYGSLANLGGPAKASADCWVPPGGYAMVGKRRIPGGMLYVGSNLPSVKSPSQVEPALIDPSAKRDDGHPDLSGQGMNYWPSYSSISPTTRSGYLAWLEGGRSDPNAGLGLVFLFFYGLERRALHDSKTNPVAREELPAIRAEVERLLGIYSGSGSFQNYATEFLGVLAHLDAGLEDGPPPRTYQGGYEVPLDVRRAAGAASMSGRAISSELAFAWATSEPSISLRTPARRCRDEFRELFLTRYEARYGQGMKVQPCKRMVRVEYRPASPSFSGIYQASTDIPDVTALVDPRRKLAELVDDVTTDLEAYSRKLGREPSSASRLAAAALLPPELLESHAPREVQALIQRLSERLTGREIDVLLASEVMKPWLPEDDGKQSKKDAIAAVSMLAHSGVGVEPDVRFGGSKVSASDKVAIFAVQPGDPEAPSSAYAAASLLVHLATMVVVSDDGVSMAEEQQLHGHITRALHLEDGERRRLAAHVALLLASPPGLAGVKRRVEALSVEQRHAIGRFLVQVAVADGHIDAAEVTTLTKLFRVLGLDPGDVHGELHAIQAQAPGADAPVLVRPAEPATPGTPIPPRPGEKPQPAASDLDMSVIEAKLQESASVSALLSSIFADEEEAEPAAVEEPDEGPLDRAHMAILRDLSQQEEWSRDEFEALAAKHGLMPDGALDTLNELAWDTCDEALIEDGDPLEINLEACKALLGS